MMILIFIVIVRFVLLKIIIIMSGIFFVLVNINKEHL